MSKPTIGFIGAGKTARALSLALNRAGYPVTTLASRTFASATQLAGQIKGCTASRNTQTVADSCQLVFINTPDSAIPVVASGLQWHPGQAVIHCSGADSTSSLVSAEDQGAQTGVFHPLQTFAAGEAVTTLQGITFALEAAEPLLATLKTLANALGGHWIVLRAEDKALYHASAVMACNYMVTLAASAANMWEKFGISPKEAITALLPLIKGTVANIEHIGLPDCLTGPIARGDVLTVHRHLEAIRTHIPNLEAVYRELGRQTMPLGHAAGKLDSATMEELSQTLAERIT